MTRSNGLKDAPYDRRTGRLLEYVRHTDPAVIDWRPNTPFLATLRIVTTERGYSSAVFIAEDTKTGARYRIFMTDMLEVLQERQINHGRVTGTWQVRKRGANFGLALAP